MSKRSVNDLLTDAHKTFDRIKNLPKDRITPDWKKEILDWTSQIANACLPLVLEPRQISKSYSFDISNNDYCIDLRATSNILPRRLEGKPKEIDEITKTSRACHEAEIELGNIICYRATLDGKLVAFKPSSSSSANGKSKIMSLVPQLFHFNFPILSIGVTWTYDITYCAHPNCGNRVQREVDHLQLCQVHGKQLLENIECRWLSAESKHIYNDIKNADERDSEEIHHRIYYQLLPQLNLWIRQIDHIISSDNMDIGVETSSIDTWLILQLRPVRLLLTLMKSAIFVYRMHLNQATAIIAAIIALIVAALQTPEIIQATINGFKKIICKVCGVIAAIFAYVGIGILYTLDLIFSDDAYIAIILQKVGLGISAIGGVLIGAATMPTALIGIAVAPIALIIGGISVATVGLTSFFIGRRMQEERDARGQPHAQLIQVHLNLTLATETLWQWTGHDVQMVEDTSNTFASLLIDY